MWTAATGFPGCGPLADTLFSDENTNRDRRELDRTNQGTALPSAMSRETEMICERLKNKTEVAKETHVWRRNADIPVCGFWRLSSRQF